MKDGRLEAERRMANPACQCRPPCPAGQQRLQGLASGAGGGEVPGCMTPSSGSRRRGRTGGGRRRGCARSPAVSSSPPFTGAGSAARTWLRRLVSRRPGADVPSGLADQGQGCRLAAVGRAAYASRPGQSRPVGRFQPASTGVQPPAQGGGAGQPMLGECGDAGPCPPPGSTRRRRVLGALAV